nr:phosphoribosylglycinamide formyltransferase [Microbacterium amylolyticum]
MNVVVLISGTGSNMRALLEAAADDTYPARVVAVGADRAASGLSHADDFGIPRFTVPFRDYGSREEWGIALADQLRQAQPDLVVLSGLMRLLPDAVVNEFAPRIINTHPAYLPEFPGAHGVRDAIAAGVTQTGASVIQVDGGIDTGPILAQERVAVLAGDTEDSLHARIKPVERRLLIDIVRRIAVGEIDLSSR